MSAASQVEGMRARYRHAVTDMQALILIAAGRDGAPLDPSVFEDAAVICRGETLALAGTPIRDAIHTARKELAASRPDHDARGAFVKTTGSKPKGGTR